MLEARLAAPALSAASWLEPPWNEKFIATSGLEASCTSQAEMPAGLTTRWIVTACAGSAASAKAAPAASAIRTLRALMSVSPVWRRVS